MEHITNKNKLDEMLWIKTMLLERYGVSMALRPLKDIADAIQEMQGPKPELMIVGWKAEK